MKDAPDGNAVFRLYRETHWGTRQEAADTLNKVAREKLGIANLGCTEQQIYRLEKVTRWPTKDYRAVIEAATGSRLEQLGFPPRRERRRGRRTDLAAPPPERHHDMVWPTTVDEARDFAMRVWEEEDARPVQTSRLEPAPVSSIAVAFHWLVAPPDHTVASDLGQRRVGQGDVLRLRRARHGLKLMDQALGGGAALPMAVTCLRRDAASLLQGRYNEETGRQLWGAVAELTLEVGWMAYDAGHQHAAQRYFLQALRCSHAAGGVLLGGRILAAMSHQALHLGRLQDAVDLARAARRGTEHVATPRTMAMLAAMDACAQAARGEAGLSLRALGDAEQALSMASEADGDPDWVDFDTGGLLGHRARVHRDLGHGEASQRAAAQAVTLCHSDHRRTRAQRAAIQAAAHLQLGDDDHAAVLGLQIIDDATALQSGLVIEEIATLQRYIRVSTTTQDFRDQARAFLAARTPSGQR